MVGVLIRMKLRVLRHSFTGSRAATTSTGLVAGLGAAGVTIWITASAGTAGQDALVLTFASWLLGWIVGPMMGGADPGVRREHLDLVPLTHLQRVTGLFGAALAGVGPLVTLVAAGALVGYAVRHGAVPVAVAVVAVVLFVLLLVALSQVAVALIGKVFNSRLSAVLMALPWGVMACVGAQSWVIITAMSDGTDAALPAAAGRVLRAAPSGWPIVAVDAAGRGDRALALAPLAGLAGLVVLALAGWSALLRRPGTRVVIQGSGSGSVWQPSGRIAAVVGKEWRTWQRDMVRIHFLAFALVYVLTFTLLPLMIGTTAYLPLTGVFLVVLATGCSAHVYSSDGTGLWQTLLAPDASRVDVRGRQLAWLAVVAPVSVVLTVGGLVWHGTADMLPWAVSLLVVMLGAGAGLFVLVSVLMPVRMADPHRRGNNPGQDGGGVATLVWISLAASTVPVAPVLALLIAGNSTGSAVLRWASLPVAIAVGTASAWGMGRFAYRRLATRGPELLARLGAA